MEQASGLAWFKVDMPYLHAAGGKGGNAGGCHKFARWGKGNFGHSRDPVNLYLSRTNAGETIGFQLDLATKNQPLPS